MEGTICEHCQRDTVAYDWYYGYFETYICSKRMRLDNASRLCEGRPCWKHTYNPKTGDRGRHTFPYKLVTYEEMSKSDGRLRQDAEKKKEDEEKANDLIIKATHMLAEAAKLRSRQ